MGSDRYTYAVATILAVSILRYYTSFHPSFATSSRGRFCNKTKGVGCQLMQRETPLSHQCRQFSPSAPGINSDVKLRLKQLTVSHCTVLSINRRRPSASLIHCCAFVRCLSYLVSLWLAGTGTNLCLNVGTQPQWRGKDFNTRTTLWFKTGLKQMFVYCSLRRIYITSFPAPVKAVRLGTGVSDQLCHRSRPSVNLSWQLYPCFCRAKFKWHCFVAKIDWMIVCADVLLSTYMRP